MRFYYGGGGAGKYTKIGNVSITGGAISGATTGSFSSTVSATGLTLSGTLGTYFGTAWGYRSLTLRGYSEYPSIVFEKTDGSTQGAIRTTPDGYMQFSLRNGTGVVIGLELTPTTGAATFSSSVTVNSTGFFNDKLTINATASESTPALLIQANTSVNT